MFLLHLLHQMTKTYRGTQRKLGPRIPLVSLILKYEIPVAEFQQKDRLPVDIRNEYRRSRIQRVTITKRIKPYVLYKNRNILCLQFQHNPKNIGEAKPGNESEIVSPILIEFQLFRYPELMHP